VGAAQQKGSIQSVVEPGRNDDGGRFGTPWFGQGEMPGINR